jgi:citrate lyase subunit beta/citryl-CoA lyase
MPPIGSDALPPDMTDRWRSLLFVPANKPDLAAKAPRSRPDVVALDLEDAVPPAGKAGARLALGEAVDALRGQAAICVRVNPPDTEWFAGDVAALPEGIDAVIVPKLESVAQLDDVATALGGRNVLAGIETVRGVLDARELLRAPVTACYFGAEDYIADLGGARTADNHEVDVPRAMLAMAARLAGVPALDMVTTDFRDEVRFRAEARSARALGYAGKLCIHPAQVTLANESFRPSPEELEWARGLLAAFAAADGQAVAYEGQMVDEPVAVRARAIVAAAGDD